MLRSGAVDAELDDELQAHLDHLVEENLARGMTPDAARAAARREFGPVTQIVEESRDARGVLWVPTPERPELRRAAMRRGPGFSSQRPDVAPASARRPRCSASSTAAAAAAR
jgi:hypothetical protein